MSSTIAHTRHPWPAARIVFIRPRFLARPNDDLGFDDGFVARLQAEPAVQGMVILDPIDRFTATETSSLLLDDGSNPNQQGELALSSALVDALLDQGFASTT